MKMLVSRNPTITAVPIPTRPGLIKLWLITNFPILVVPDLSKLMAASRVG